MMNHDPELPAGFSDSDLWQADLEAQARMSARLRARGICDHGWIQGRGSDGEWHGEGPAPAVGHAKCLHCGKEVPDKL